MLYSANSLRAFSVSEESKRESVASTTSTGRGSVGEEPLAERYGFREDVHSTQHAITNSHTYSGVARI